MNYVSQTILSFFTFSAGAVAEQNFKLQVSLEDKVKMDNYSLLSLCLKCNKKKILPLLLTASCFRCRGEMSEWWKLAVRSTS